MLSITRRHVTGENENECTSPALSKLSSIFIRNLFNIFTSHLRMLAGSLRMITCCYELFTIHTDTIGLLGVICGFLRAIYGWLRVVTSGLRILTDCYESFTDKINPWTIVRRFLTCQKNCLCFTDPYECLRIVTRYLRIPASYLRMLTIDYELAIRKDS